MDKDELYKKYLTKQPMSVEECEWLVYFESLKSRGDSDHEKGDDPLVGALVRNQDGVVIALAHRANGLEGDHAEYSILKGQLAGCDLSGCSFFTTLEPCVDDVRGKEGASCASLLCSSAVKTVHIGVLDPNPSVYSVGIAKLFESGKIVIPFSSETRNAIGELFSNKKQNATPSSVRRLKREIFAKFEQNALNAFLEDKYYFEHGTLEGYDFEKASNELAAYLLDKGWVRFKAKEAFVEDGVKIMFYDSRYLETTNRVVMMSRAGEFSNRTAYSLPLLMREMNQYWSQIVGTLPYVVFKEAFVNAFIHSDFSPDSPLIYVSYDKLCITLDNYAAPSISQMQLDKLPVFQASPEPGNGCLSELARLCGYCERDKRGEKTFIEHQDKITCTVEGRHVRLELRVL